MKHIIVFLLSLLLINPSFAQTEKLLKQEKLMTSKVKIGMSADEVKKVIGRPNAVEGGFPNSDKFIIKDLPEQAGQINNSTWFYIYPTFKVSYKKEGLEYYINGDKTTEEIYKSYQGKENIYIYGGSVVPFPMGDSYRILNSAGLRIRQINKETTFVEDLPPRTVQENFTPILCIIFDKGTQVVALQKVYFKIIIK